MPPNRDREAGRDLDESEQHALEVAFAEVTTDQDHYREWERFCDGWKARSAWSVSSREPTGASGDLAKALMVAIRVHAGQVDKQGEPYLLHVLRVVEAVEGERAKVLAALHDVLEDAVVVPSLEELFEENGMWIENSVEVLTRQPGESYAEYIESIADGHSATWVDEVREVKLADLRDNLGRIPSETCTHCDGAGKEVVTARMLSGPGEPFEIACEECGGTGRDPSADRWVSLKARYEKAIATLEIVRRSAQGCGNPELSL